MGTLRGSPARPRKAAAVPQMVARGRGSAGGGAIRPRLPGLPSRAHLRRQEGEQRAVPIHYALRQRAVQIPRRRIYWPTLA